jgi:hypothetical protein
MAAQSVRSIYHSIITTKGFCTLASLTIIADNKDAGEGKWTI